MKRVIILQKKNKFFWIGWRPRKFATKTIWVFILFNDENICYKKVGLFIVKKDGIIDSGDARTQCKNSDLKLVELTDVTITNGTCLQPEGMGKKYINADEIICL